MSADTSIFVTRVDTPFGLLNVIDHRGVGDVRAIIRSGVYSERLAPGVEFTVDMGGRVADVSSTYRAKMFRKGLYLGHHFGSPGIVEPTVDAIRFCLHGGTAEQYRCVLWQYAIKFYLTIRSIQAAAVHIKATTVANESTQGLLFVGRGGSGKSTLATALAQFGLHVIGNTHAVVKDGHAWTCPTWVRTRIGGEEIFLPPPCTPVVNDCDVRAIVVVSYNSLGEFNAGRITPVDAAGVLYNYAYAIGAYDLKEDVCDAFTDEEGHGRALSVAHQHFSDEIMSLPIHMVSADITSQRSLESVAAYVSRALATGV